MWHLKNNGPDELIYILVIQSQMQKANLWLPEGQKGWEELGDWD